MMQSHFKMASYNVHATPRALSFRLGSANQPSNLLAGSSNAGLDEPRQNLAFSLVQVNSLLIGPKFSLDDVVSMKMLIKLRDEAVKALRSEERRVGNECVSKWSSRCAAYH